MEREVPHVSDRVQWNLLLAVGKSLTFQIQEMAHHGQFTSLLVIRSSQSLLCFISPSYQILIRRGSWASQTPDKYLQSSGASQVALAVKKLPANAGDVRDVDLIPGSRRPPEGGNGNPLQYSYLENPTVREAWWARVHLVAKSQT